MAEPTPTQSKPKRVAFSGMEVMFWDEMKKIGAHVEAAIHRPAQEWAPATYSYKLTLANGTVRIGVIPWNIETFSRILAIATEATKEGASS